MLTLIAINFAYFAPVVFQGKQIPQDDIKLGLAKGKEIVDYRAETGDEPLWTNAMFSGMPTFQMSTIYPNNVLQYVSTSFTALGASSSVYIVALLMLGFFFLLRGEKVDPWLSVAGAEVGAMAPAARDAWRARTIGFLPQRLLLSEALNVADNLARRPGGTGACWSLRWRWT